MNTGNFFSDEKSSHGMMAGYAVTKNEWVLKSFDRFKVDVINLSGDDLTFIRRLMAGGSMSTVSDSAIRPLLSRIVSASVPSSLRDDVPVRSYIVMSVPNRNAPSSSPVRVAFVGISDDQTAVPGLKLAGLKVEDPVEAAKRIVPQAKRESDLVIVLAHLTTEIASRIPQEVPGVDAVIAGNGKEFTVPLTVGRVPVVFTPYETRMLGELRFYRNPDGGYAIKNRFVGLDNTIPDDQADAAFVAESKLAIKKEVETFTKPLEPASPQQRLNAGTGSANSNFVSAQSCLECHRAEYMIWSNTAHARAINSLATRAAELDSGCLVCHTTGFNRGGFQDIAQTRALINVQCEECHGPGRDHIAKPDKTYGHIADMQAVCSKCHTAETSAAFKLDEFWSRIRH